MASSSSPAAPGFPQPGTGLPHTPATPGAGELQSLPVVTEQPRARSIFAFADPVTKPLARTMASLQESRQKLGLPNPGTIEGLTVPVRTCHASNLFFDGARADLAKTVSFNPIFQVTHSFTHGAQGAPPSYQFGAVLGTNNVRQDQRYGGQMILSSY